jgi:hypothetical protein
MAIAKKRVAPNDLRGRLDLLIEFLHSLAVEFPDRKDCKKTLAATRKFRRNIDGRLKTASLVDVVNYQQQIKRLENCAQAAKRIRRLGELLDVIAAVEPPTDNLGGVLGVWRAEINQKRDTAKPGDTSVN